MIIRHFCIKMLQNTLCGTNFKISVFYEKARYSFHPTMVSPQLFRGLKAGEPRAGWRRGSQGGGRAGSVSRLSVSLICLDFHQTEAEREEKNQNSDHLWKNSIKRLSVLVKWKETISTKKNGIENIFEDIVPGNDSNLSKIAIHRSWNHANPEHYNYKKSHLRSIRAKLLKIKDKKAAGWKKERDLLHIGEE